MKRKAPQRKHPLRSRDSSTSTKPTTRDDEGADAPGKPAIRERWFRDPRTISLLLALLVLVSAVPPYLSRLAAGMSSDLLILPDLYESLVLRGESWSSWAMGGVLYLFPDLAFFFPLAAVVGDTYKAFLLLTALWIMLFWMGIFLLGRARVGQQAHRSAVWILLLAVLVTHPQIWPAGAGLWRALYHPTVHGGGCLAILGSMLLVLGHLQRSRAYHLVILAPLCVASTVSDLLYCVYFSLPCTLSLALLALLRPEFRRRALAPILTIIIATVLARVLLPWLAPGSHAEAQVVARFGLGTAWKTARFMLHDLQAHGRWTFVAAALVSFAATGWLVVEVVLMSVRRSPFSGTAFYLDSSVILGLVGGWAAVLSTGNYADGHSWRYLVFPSTLALVVAVWTAAPRLPRWADIVGTMVLVGLSLGHGLSRPQLDRPYPPLARLIDTMAQSQRLLVVGDYWAARRTTFLNRAGIRVEQICSDGRPYRWANSTESLRRIRKDSSQTALVIMDRLNPQEIRRAYGQPTRQETVAGSLVYVYAPPLSLGVAQRLTSP